jgi:fatty acid desaturase
LRRQADTARDAQPCREAGQTPWPYRNRIQEVEIVALLILLALIVALFIGLGFVIKWLFIVAVVAALVWLITFFTRGAA